MPVPTGTVFQVCHLVHDLESALRHWTGTLGIGPFFVLPPRSFAWLTLHGAPASDHAIIESVALGQSGDMQVELIVPGPAPSCYRDFLDSGKRGVHHLGRASRDFDTDRRRAIDAGLDVVMEGGSALTRFAYLEDRSAGRSPCIELIEMTPPVDALFDRVREASRQWDWTDPVRSA